MLNQEILSGKELNREYLIRRWKKKDTNATRKENVIYKKVAEKESDINVLKVIVNI